MYFFIHFKKTHLISCLAQAFACLSLLLSAASAAPQLLHHGVAHHAALGAGQVVIHFDSFQCYLKYQAKYVILIHFNSKNI